MREFLHVYIVPKPGIARAEIEKKLSLAVDWIRYGEGCYVIYTNSDVTKWKARLIDFVKPGGNLFIVELNIHRRKGFMSNEFWAWITKRLP